MTVKLHLIEERVEFLKSQLGQVTYLSKPDSDGYVYVSFEVSTNADVLSVFHAGINFGIDYTLKKLK